MTAMVLLNDLRKQGVTVKANGDKVRLEAPKGIVTPEIQELVKEYKLELLALLAQCTSSQSQPCFACHTFSWIARPCGSWVCSTCHPVAHERASMPYRPAPTLAGDLLRLVEVLGWPRWEFAPGQSVSGEVNWHRFVATASEVELRVALEAVGGGDDGDDA